MAGDTGNAGVGNVLDRICAAGILCNCRIVEIDVMVRVVVHDVFQNSTESQCLEDFWLGFSRQIDRFRIASALDIEDSFAGPAMLVVTDQRTARVGGQCRFSCSGQAEQESRTYRWRDPSWPNSAWKARRVSASDNS